MRQVSPAWLESCQAFPGQALQCRELWLEGHLSPPELFLTFDGHGGNDGMGMGILQKGH